MSDFNPPIDAWRPDLPDFRDYTPDDERVQRLLRPLRRRRSAAKGLPKQIDLREYFPAVSDQQRLNASAAHACVGLLEYFQRRVHGTLAKGSVRFVYKTSRKLMRGIGNVSTDLRTTLKAIVRFGVPPAEYCPYEEQRFDEEPDPFLYSFSGETSAIVYLRLDARNQGGSETLSRVKSFLAAGWPCVFGFSVPNSLTRDADIPWRPADDAIRGGQAVVAAGYDDSRVRSTKGALLVRNSWGPGWGDDGYGWLPYRFVEQQLATVFWTLLDESWIASREFLRPDLPGLQTAPRRSKPRAGTR